MKIYEILQNLYLGKILDHPDEDPGIPIGFTRTPVDVPEGMWAIWTGTGWNLTDQPPPQ